jgi:phosphoribosylanthranilate isomerase
MRTRIKICGITRLQDAEAVAQSGADAIGFIFWKNSPRYIEPASARSLVRAVGPFVATVGVFVNPARDEVEHARQEAGISVLQFHGEETPAFCGAFGMPYIKAFKVGQQGDLIKSTEAYGEAAGWLFDAYDEKRVGGTGETFDWDRIPASLSRPLVLSGGLSPSNIVAAVRKLRPYAVDVSSGVETGKGIKDAAKIAAFVQGVRNADQ